MKTLTYFFLALTTLCSGLHAATDSRQATDFTLVAKKAIPAVVSINVKGTAKAGSDWDFDGSSPSSDDIWSRFFGFPGSKSPKEREFEGLGSGFLISPDGVIITNSHVIDEAKDIKVTLNDGRSFVGKVLGQDPNTDVAVVKIDAKDLPYVKLGNSDALEVGQWVVAIGNSLGLQATLTVGVVSAKGRSGLDLTRIEDFIQTDAAINRGNSGGPLLNLDAEVVGINTAIVSNMSSGGYMGIGFAIPSKIAKYDVDQILEKGTISRGYIGVALQQLDQDLAKAFGLKKAEGALVADVVKDSPAAKGGLKQGDIILKLNGQTVEHVAQLRNSIAMTNPGSTVTLSVLHPDKTTADLKVEIADFPAKELAVESAELNASKMGIQVANLTPEKAKTLGLSEPKGVLISGVMPNSLAYSAGIRKDAIIISVNHQPVNSLEDYNKAITDAGESTLYLIKQGNVMRYFLLKE